MTEARTEERLRPADVIARYGNCLEMMPMDVQFHNISIGLYYKDGVLTVWTFSQKPGASERIREVRDQLVALGGLRPVEGTTHQAVFPCGQLHRRPLKFLLYQAVGKSPDYTHPEGQMSIKDSKSALTLMVNGREEDGQWVYGVSAQGEAKNSATRERMVVAGFLRYGEMAKLGDTTVAFPCGQRHDELLRLLLPYSRNISSVESMMEAEAMRSQMTTGTLGFSPM